MSRTGPLRVSVCLSLDFAAVCVIRMAAIESSRVDLSVCLAGWLRPAPPITRHDQRAAQQPQRHQSITQSVAHLNSHRPIAAAASPLARLPCSTRAQSRLRVQCRSPPVTRRDRFAADWPLAARRLSGSRRITRNRSRIPLCCHHSSWEKGNKQQNRNGSKQLYTDGRIDQPVEQ